MIQTINILNMDRDLFTISATELISISNINNNKPHNNSNKLLSDCDEELLILIGFKQSINLKSITLY